MPGKHLAAVIWDMDGVIADTGSYHFQAWQQAFGRRGVSYSEDDFRRNFGRRNDTIIRETLGAGLADAEVIAIAEEKEETYRRIMGERITALPGSVELIRSLQEQGVRMAIASSAPEENIRLVLGALGILNIFQAVVFGREVKEGKPHPEVFLLAAARLGVVPGQAVVIEDAVAGVTAAKRAGMKCLAVANSHPAESLGEADLVVETLAGVSVATLGALFR